MRHFYFFGIFLQSMLLCAQISIKPSATGDSYAYVDNRVLFVEKGINLVKNNSSETEASIYLRNEAQLLQGEKSDNNNSGNGFLSVYQEGTSNAYDYNYWSMPVIDNFDNNNAFGNVLYEPQTTTRSRRAIITESHEGSANPLQISRRWIYTFSGTSYSEWRYAGKLFDLTPGEGFTMKGVNGTNLTEINGVKNNPGNNQRYDFRGKANDGAIRVPIATGKMVLVGNPYPSALDMKTFLMNNTATTGIAYFWDSRKNGNSHYLKDYEGGYGAYSPGANMYVPATFLKYDDEGEPVTHSGNSGGEYGREFAPIAQGFMLMGASNSEVTFLNSHRIFKQENPGDSSFKASAENGNENSDERIPSLRLDVEFNDLYIRQLALAFRSDATINNDWAMDAETFGEVGTDAAWLIDDKNFVINVRSFDSKEKIPLSIKVTKSSEVRFTAHSHENINGEEVFLYDSEEDFHYNLMHQTHAVKLEKGNFDKRFFITFSDGSLSKEEITVLEEEEKTLLGGLQVLQNNQQSQLEISTGELQLQKISLYGMGGNLIFSSFVPAGKNLFTFPTNNLSDAIYIVKITTEDNQQISKKVTVKN